MIILEKSAVARQLWPERKCRRYMTMRISITAYTIEKIWADASAFDVKPRCSRRRQRYEGDEAPLLHACLHRQYRRATLAYHYERRREPPLEIEIAAPMRKTARSRRMPHQMVRHEDAQNDHAPPFIRLGHAGIIFEKCFSRYSLLSYEIRRYSHNIPEARRFTFHFPHNSLLIYCGMKH